MSYSTIVLTAGISVLNPRNHFGQRFREAESPLTFPLGQQNPEARDAAVSGSDLLKTSLRFAPPPRQEPDPRCYSAEYSVLYQLMREGRLSSGAVVHLIHTPSFAGRLAVELQMDGLERFLGVHPQQHELPVPFDPAIPGGLALASGAFIGLVSHLLEGHDPSRTAFAPIGGDKVMAALGHVAASFHGFPSLYLHEDSQRIQEISPAPVAIDAAMRATVAPVARRVGNGAEWRSLTPTEQGVIVEQPAFFTRAEDLVGLNELGQYLRLAEFPILLSKEAAAEMEAATSIISRQLGQLRTQAVTNPDYRGINHDLVSAPGRHHPWRLAQMGDAIRIAWQMTPDAIIIGKIWRDHDTYNREAACFIQTSLPTDNSHIVALPWISCSPF